MRTGAKFGGLVVVFAMALVTDAAAYPLELAKKCRALTEETYPLRIPGNPAAGSDKATGAEMRFYYKSCVDNGGEAIDLRP